MSIWFWTTLVYFTSASTVGFLWKGVSTVELQGWQKHTGVMIVKRTIDLDQNSSKSGSNLKDDNEEKNATGDVHFEPGRWDKSSWK